MTANVKDSRLVLLAQSVGDRFGIWIILALGAILRFVNLGYPHKLVFDETYYVKDAYTLSKLGYEGAWPEDPNAAFQAGRVDTFLTDPSYVVHPPLGKWIISLGINIFGAENSFGWRFSVAVLGVASIGLLYLVAKRMFGSKRWSLVAAFLLAIDGHAMVLSRTGLLDGILAFFALLAFYFLLRDRDGSLLQTWPRPWLLAMGVTLGAASAVKWSGLYVLVAFVAYVVGSDVLRARRITQAAQIKEFNWAKNILRRAAVAFFVTVPAAILTYLVSWTGWLVTTGGYYRDWVAAPGSVPSFLAWVPQSLQALWHYHQQAYGFHVGLHSSHPYAASPLGWLLMLRPTSFFYEGNKLGQNGCQFEGGCSSAITALGNPAIWWVAVVALVLVAINWFKTRDRQAGLILLGIGAGYLPWLIYLNRTTFQFYSIVFLPWMLLALVYVLRAQVASHSPEYRPRSRLRTLAYLGGTFLLSLFFVPIWIGTTVPYWFWLIHMWIPTWV
jgi:dolichyl-phosphate-mannose--protein O-mannosyl transferase